MLIGVKTWLQTHGSGSVAQLSAQFHTAPEVMGAMLTRLERAGLVTRAPAPPKCCGCTQCGPDAALVYAWCGTVDAGHADRTPPG